MEDFSIWLAWCILLLPFTALCYVEALLHPHRNRRDAPDWYYMPLAFGLAYLGSWIAYMVGGSWLWGIAGMVAVLAVEGLLFTVLAIRQIVSVIREDKKLQESS